MLALRSVAAVAITGVAPLIFSSIPGILGFHASLSRRDGGGAVVTRRMYHFDLLSPPRVLSTQHHASVTTGKSSSFSAEDNNSIETPATVPQQQRGSPRHDVRGNDIDADEIDEEEMKVQHNFMEHQKNAPKLGWAVDIRTLVQYNHGFAVMSTNSKS